MQVATQAAALLLARRDEPLARALQILGQLLRLPGLLCGIERDAGLLRQIVQQPAVEQGEGLARPARRQDQLSDSLALVDQRQPDRRVGRRFAPGGERLPVNGSKSRLQLIELFCGQLTSLSVRTVSATYGSLSAAPMDSTIAGATASGANAPPRRRPSRDSTA